MKRIRSFLKDEHGNVLVLVSVAMVGLIGLLGLVTDAGMVYIAKSNLKKEATTAVLSAAQELTNSETNVNDVANQILQSYKDSSSVEDIQIEMNNKVTIRLKKYVPFYFAAIFGFNGTTVHEEASSQLFPIGKLSGVTPLGVDQSMSLVYGQTYTLKVGSGDSQTGNFGILALQGPGAKNYLDTLEHGFDQPLTVGDIVSTQTGDLSGPTSTGVAYRMQNCPYPDGDYYHRTCSRIMPVIVYTPYSTSNGKLVSVKVTGFAYFYLSKPGTDTSVINGIFIKRVDAGTYGNGANDRGAYTARLVE